MKKILFGMLAIGATAIAFAAPAGAAPPNPSDPQGLKCRFNSATDVTAESQTQTGYAAVGPIGMPTTATPYVVRCQIYVNGIASGAALTATSVNAGAVQLAAGAGTITYHANVTDVVAMCTTVTYGSWTKYWQPDNSLPQIGTVLGTWSTTFDVNKCGLAVTIDPNPEACPPLLTIDKALDDGNLLSDTWQDCEPYSPII